AKPRCELCHFFPVRLNTGALVRRLGRKIAKLEPGPRREKLEQLRCGLDKSDTITLYLHGKKELFTFSMLKAAIPTLTRSNWTLVRDYIFYGPTVAPTPGLGSLFFSLADRFCSRKTIHLVVVPAIADLRLEYAQAVTEAQYGKAIWIRTRASWELWSTIALCLWRKGR